MELLFIIIYTMQLQSLNTVNTFLSQCIHIDNKLFMLPQFLKIIVGKNSRGKERRDLEKL